MKVLTEMHLKTAKAMPRKAPQLWLGEKEDRRYRTAAKKERNLIAKYYRFVRANPDIGSASVAHRYGVVTTGTQARQRTGVLPSS